MKPHIKVITLGVDDLKRAVRFYRDGLGLPTKGITGTEFEYGAVAFFDLQGGLILATWLRTSLAHDSELPVSEAGPPTFSIGHNVATREEVDQVIAQAEAAGAEVVRKPHDTFWGGYGGYFRDPDGHLWEVLWNPAFVVNGEVI
jgi:catechol 2,3-dioxygenase-like lactoylglutathione lyase family enzyme